MSFESLNNHISGTYLYLRNQGIKLEIMRSQNKRVTKVLKSHVCVCLWERDWFSKFQNLLYMLNIWNILIHINISIYISKLVIIFYFVPYDRDDVVYVLWYWSRIPLMVKGGKLWNRENVNTFEDNSSRLKMTVGFGGGLTNIIFSPWAVSCLAGCPVPIGSPPWSKDIS